jgi:sugar phosphate permease
MRALIVWGAGDLYFICCMVAAIILGMLAPDIQNQLGLSNAQLGVLGSAFFMSYGVSQFIAGHLLDACGPRLVLSVSALTAAFGLYLFSAAESFTGAVVAQLIAGAGMSTSYIGAIYLARMWFASERFALMSGVTAASSNIFATAAILGLAFFGGAVIHFRVIMFYLACIMLFAAILLVAVVRKTNGARQQRSNLNKDLSIMDDVRLLVKLPQYWLSVLYFSASFGVLLAFANLWNIPYQLSFGHSLQVAAMLNSMLPLGGIFGAVLAGWWAVRLNSLARVARFYSAGMVITMGILIYAPPLPMPLAFSLLTLAGFFMSGAVLGFPLADQHLPPSLRGTGFGLMATMAYLFSALLQYLIGVLLGSTLEPPGSLAALHEFRLALSPLMAALILGCIGSGYLQKDKR